MNEADVKYLEQPAKTLKLSEAIRIGAKMRPQGRLAMFSDGKSCAFGAAYEGIGGNYREGMHLFETPSDFFGSVWRAGVDGKYLADEILRRNDDRRETRESIADWLESIGY